MRRQILSFKRKWTPEELAILRHLATSGFSARVIGYRLGRSARSVRQRAMRLLQAIRRPRRGDRERLHTTRRKSRR